MKNFQRKTVWLSMVAFLSAALFGTGCTTAVDPWAEAPGEGTHVLVSFPPLYSFVKNVAGDHAKVLSLTSTIGPHDYAPTGHDAQKAIRADLFLVNGLGLDDWIVRVKNSSGNQELKVVKVAEAIPEEKLLEGGCCHHDHGDGHGHDHHHHHHHGEHDPHVWLGIDEAVILVEKIRDELSAVDPGHKETFHANAKQYVQELKNLHEYGKEKFKGKKNRRVITTHDSLGYFARSFDLEVVDHIMPQPGVDADANKLKKLVDLITDKEKPVRIITVEPQYTKATAETLLRQVRGKLAGGKVEMVEFDTIETAPSRRELTAELYINIMKANIDRLAKAME